MHEVRAKVSKKKNSKENKLIIEMDLPWPPSLNRAYRHVQGRVLLSSDGRAYKKKVKRLFEESSVIPFGVDDRLAVTMYAFPPDRRARDLDNLFKLVFDAMQPLPIPDDSQIDVITMARGGVKPGGVLMVRIELAESY